MSGSQPGAGVLTFLIADVRGYTSFTQSRGDEAAARLASKFAEIAREAVEAHGGEVIELRGDEALAVFVSAREALRAAVDLQLVLADEVELDGSLPLRVGMGLDAGEAVPVDGGYRGGALNLAARLCSQARAGEVLASQGVRHLARALEGIELHDYGEADMKGLAEPVRVFRVAPSGLDPDALALRFEPGAAPAVVERTDLPAALDPVTPIVGRELDVRKLRWAWRQARRGEGALMLVAGPTGIGKTRLAAECALTAAENGASVAYVSFAATREPLGAAEAAFGGARPAYVVLDDLEAVDPDQQEELLSCVTASDRAHALVLAVFDDERAPSELVAGLRRLSGEDAVVRPAPLGLDDIRRIAGLYLGDAVEALPSGLLESSGGVPRRVHEQVADWAHAEARRRLGGFASQAAAGRSDLRSVEADLASSVVDLQFVRERARLYGAGPGRDAAEPTESPYKGLVAFDVEDAEWFFGRERLVADLIARLAGAALLGVVGPSGSGKSSAVRAGLIPALGAGVLPGSDEWLVLVMRPGEHPLRELDRTFWSSLPKPVLDRIAGQDAPLRAVRDVLSEGERLVVFVDQFEEVFTACSDEGERTAFVAALTEAARDPRGNVVLVLAVRADFYGRCATDPGLAELLGANHVLVGPMSADEYRRAIEQPALRAGVRFDAALVDELVGEVLGEPGALPLLSTALLELWERRDGRTITVDAYEQTGGVRGAVASLAEDVYSGFDAEQQAIVRSALLRMAGPGEGAAVVRRRVPLSEFDVERNPRVAEVLEVLTSRRLLTVSEGSVEVAHEALLREWPRFQQWLEEDRDGRRLHGHLMETAREWADRGRDPADLYRGARLASALDWTTEHTLELNEVEREFVNASRSENERELTRQRKHNRRLRSALVGVGILLLLAIAAGAAALVARSNAQHEATVALARELGAEAVSEPRIDRAMLLAREAVNLDDSTATQGTLLATLLRSPAALATFAAPIDSRPQRVALSPDGRTLAAVDNTASVRFYDTRARRLRATVHNLGHGTPPTFTPDSSRYIAFGGQNTPLLDLRDTRTNRIVRQLPFDKQWLTKPSDMGGDMLILPDGRTALWAYGLVNPNGSPGTDFVDRWDLQAGKLVSTTRIGGHGVSQDGLVDGGRELVVYSTAGPLVFVDTRTLRPVRTLELHVPGVPIVSPDGRRVAVATSGGTVVFVDVATGKQTDGQGAHTGPISSLAFSPDGSKLVTGSEDGSIIVWDAASGAVLERLLGHGNRVLGLAFADKGRTLWSCSLDGAIFEWDLGTDRRFGRSFGQQGDVSIPNDVPQTPPLAVSPDGAEFAVRSGTSGVLIRSTASAGVVKRFQVPGTGGDVTALAWGRSGLLAIAGQAGYVALWSISGTPHVVRVLKGLGAVNRLPEAVQAIAFSPDGSLLVAGDINHTPGATPPLGRVVAWQISSGKPVWKNTHRQGAVHVIAFSRDGMTVGAGYDDSHVVLFDARTGRTRRMLRENDGGPPGVYALAFSPDGEIAAGDWAGIVRVWNTATGAAVGQLTLVHPSPVASIHFSVTGDVFATTGGSDGFARLWSSQTRRQFGSTFPGDPGHWGNAVYTPDGSELVVAFDDGSGYVWPTSPRVWEEHACSVAGRNFTHEEWRRFVGGRSYTRVCPQFPAGS